MALFFNTTEVNITDIIVTPDRRMHMKTTKIGTMGESGVVQFRFILPPLIKDTSVELFRKELLFANEIGKCRKIMHGDTFTLTEDLTQGGWLEMQLKLTLGNCVWKTAPVLFEFYPALDIIPGIKCKSDIEGKTTFVIPFVENLTGKRRYPPHIPKGIKIPLFHYGEMTVTLPLYCSYHVRIKDIRACNHYRNDIVPNGRTYPAMPHFAENVNLKLYGYNPPVIDLTNEDLHMYIDPIGPEIIIEEEELFDE